MNINFQLTKLIFMGFQLNSTTAGSHGKSVFTFVRNHQTVLQSGSTTGHSTSSERRSTLSPVWGVVGALDLGRSQR